MGRKREFDAEVALRQCMEVFWAKGYQTTCLDDLTATTGVKKQSLYGAFASKRALFLQALALYREESVARLEALAASDAPPLKQLQLIRDLILRGDETCRGCLMLNTALEFGASDEEVRRETEAMYTETERILTQIIRRAQTEQQLTARHPADELAAYLTNVIRGAQVMAKSGADPEHTAAVVDTAFSLMAP